MEITTPNSNPKTAMHFSLKRFNVIAMAPLNPVVGRPRK